MPKPSARCATSWPMRPKPSTPSVFSYSSTPLNSERSHAPPVSDSWAWGTLRASAKSIASVCSAAVITFDCGAFATTTPRLVAASTSTLSTPTPARPTAFSRLARSSRPAVSCVADRIRIASNSPMRRSSSPSSQSMPSSTSKPASRSNSTPESPIFSLTRTFTSGRRRNRHASLEEHTLRGGDARAELDVVAEIVEGHFQSGDGDDDVEGAEVAAVSDARDLALQVSLAAGDRDAESVAHELRDGCAVDRLRQCDRRDDVRVIVDLAEGVQLESAGRLTCRATEQAVAVVDGVEPLPIDQAESH